MENVPAEAQIIVPTVKIVIVPINICLVVNHCNNNADIGITIPITSMNPVAIHWTVVNEIPNSAFKVVIAMFNNVSFKIAKNAPIISDNIIGITFLFGSSAKYSYLFFFIKSPFQLKVCILNKSNVYRQKCCPKTCLGQHFLIFSNTIYNRLYFMPRNFFFTTFHCFECSFGKC